MTFDEDRSQVRVASLPIVMASLRDTALNLMRLTGFSEIAFAWKYL